MSATPAVTERVSGRRQPERGAALVFALLGLATLTILGLGLTSLGIVGTKMTSNERDTQEALALADAGLAHARKLITYHEWDWPNLTPFLVSGNGAACDGDELSQAPTQPVGTLTPFPANYPTLFVGAAAAGGTAIGTGTYRVYVCDDHLTDLNELVVPAVLDANENFDANRRILVRSVGITASGATVTLEQVLGAQTVPAVLVNGNVEASGDVQVAGSSGAIHANGDMDVQGTSVCAQQQFSATGNISGSVPEGGPGCNQPGELWPGEAPINVRMIDPAQFRHSAQYWLRTVPAGGGPGCGGGGGAGALRGEVWVNTTWNPATGTGTATSDAQFVPLATGVCTWADWSFSSQQVRWSTNSNAILKTTYHATTNIALGGNVDSLCDGPTTTPLTSTEMTVLASGWVTVAGGAKLCGKLKTPTIGRITIVAGTDLDMAGNTGGGPLPTPPPAMYEGLYYARHQINLQGTPVIRGQLVAVNLADTNFPLTLNNSNPVQLDNGGNMSISGNAYVEWSSGGMTATRPQTWRECRADPLNVNPFRPDDACGALYGGPN